MSRTGGVQIRREDQGGTKSGGYAGGAEHRQLVLHTRSRVTVL